MSTTFFFSLPTTGAVGRLFIGDNIRPFLQLLIWFRMCYQDKKERMLALRNSWCGLFEVWSLFDVYGALQREVLSDEDAPCAVIQLSVGGFYHESLYEVGPGVW